MSDKADNVHAIDAKDETKAAVIKWLADNAFDQRQVVTVWGGVEVDLVECVARFADRHSHSEKEALEQEVSRLRAERDEWKEESDRMCAAASEQARYDATVTKQAKDRAESAESRLSVAMEIVKEVAQSRLCEWVRHTIPEWTTEVETSMEQMDALIRRSQALISKEGK